MQARLLFVAAVTSSLVIAAACSRSAGAPSPPEIRLTTPRDGGAPYVEVAGLSDDSLLRLRDAELTSDEWTRILRVAVDDEGPAMLGDYSVDGGALRFTPSYALDPGRQYQVRFDPIHVPGPGNSGAVAIVARVGRPAGDTTPSTVVTKVYPTGNMVPENLLRMYVEFSGPMGRPSGIQHMSLIDEGGKEIPGAFLPLDYEFWSPDHTRFTAFFDPGRVKGGILPNQQMGRALAPGRSVTLVIRREWRDEHGLPLKGEYRRTLHVGAPLLKPLDLATWRIQPPAAVGQRDALVVTFPGPLDHGLLMRAVGVRRAGSPVEGDVSIGEAETRWTFTPREPWRSGGHELLVLDTLEDPAGNQIGRAFEVDTFETVDKSPTPKAISIPFRIGS